MSILCRANDVNCRSPLQPDITASIAKGVFIFSCDYEYICRPPILQWECFSCFILLCSSFQMTVNRMKIMEIQEQSYKGRQRANDRTSIRGPEEDRSLREDFREYPWHSHNTASPFIRILDGLFNPPWNSLFGTGGMKDHRCLLASCISLGTRWLRCNYNMGMLQVTLV